MPAEAEQTEKTDDFLRKFTRELPVTLNDHENQVYGKMLAEKVNELKLAEDRKKQVVADHNNRIKVIENEITRIAVARAKGEELRPVMCGERLHGNVIEIVRIDRGEVVDTRPADLKDLQTEMPGMGMPQIPDGFDEGPRGDALGSLRDQPVEASPGEPGGEMVESSTGDQVFVADDEEDADDEDPLRAVVDADDELICDACGEPVTEDDETIEMHGSTIHALCGDDPEKVAKLDPGNLVQGYFGTPGQGAGESEDEMIDRKLAEREAAEPKPGSAAASVAQRDRDIAQREKEIAESKSQKKKPTRERSKKANAQKSKGKKK